MDASKGYFLQLVEKNRGRSPHHLGEGERSHQQSLLDSIEPTPVPIPKAFLPETR